MNRLVLLAHVSRGVVVAALLSAAAHGAEERLDHRGSVGLLLGVGGEVKSAVAAGGLLSDSGRKVLFDLGGTYALGYDGNELLAMVRHGRGANYPEWALFGGYRGYFGKDRLKTFFDLDLALQWVPGVMFTAGPRVGFGVQVELLSVLGVYLGAAGQAGFGGGLRFSGEISLGVQLRTYLLE